MTCRGAGRPARRERSGQSGAGGAEAVVAGVNSGERALTDAENLARHLEPGSRELASAVNLVGQDAHEEHDPAVRHVAAQ